LSAASARPTTSFVAFSDEEEDEEIDSSIDIGARDLTRFTRVYSRSSPKLHVWLPSRNVNTIHNKIW
jgi:hypothetical protein